jgi:hypothetical protein
MDSAAIKEVRIVLRQVQEHLFNAHLQLGAQWETLGLVDVVHHPNTAIPDLNYVTPRRNTAWVPGPEIQTGLNHLLEYKRTPRVQYIEGLFPPMFAKTLHDLNLEIERETPIMVYKADGFNGVVPPAPKTPVIPDGVTIEAVTDQRGLELWWYVWRNAFYEVLTLGVEPVFVGRDLKGLKNGYHFDYLAMRGGSPVGVVRVSVHGETAHLLALALLKEARTPEMIQLLQLTATQAALERGCTMIFAPGETDADRRLCREIGFMDTGSMVCYSARSVENSATNGEESTGNALEQHFLTPRW